LLNFCSCYEGAADAATHKIYIWDISNDGQLSSALDGGREPLIHVHVSPESEYYAPSLIPHSGIRANPRSHLQPTKGIF
jgi:hypothetical protein